MKKRLALAIIFSFILLITSVVKVSAWGPITHFTLLDDIINDPRLDPGIKKVLQENLQYTKGGAIGPDLFYFSDKRFSDMAHYCSTDLLVTTMLKHASELDKLISTSHELAFAYGWIIHVATDSVGHQWVNSEVKKLLPNLPPDDTGEYDPNNSAKKNAHSTIERAIDKLNFNTHSYGYDVKGNTTFESNYYILWRAYSDAYICENNAPTIDDENTAQVRFQAALHNYNKIFPNYNENRFNNPEYQQAYQESINRAIKALNSSGITLKNWDLDTGQSPYDDFGNPNKKYTGDQKCKNQCQLDKYCAPVPASSPGGDHPDDTVSVDSDNNTSESASLDSLYRLAVKKGKTWILWQKALADANAEYEVLPSDASPELRQEKLNKISILVNMLNDPFNYREFTINNPQFSTEKLETPDVAVLENGYFEDATGLINKWKEPVRTVTTSFNPEIVKSNPVLVIPSGGLYGLENSSMLKSQLSEYTKNGGTLIVFAQQHGYEFNILPVPQESDGTFKTISGYGWIEDQSCFTNAVYIDIWHQILSGQSKSTPTLNVDGYFTNYPSNSTVVLRRTANGQPALLTYDYGQGKVIVTSMYSDWAYGHSQASAEEIALVRDMISWAKSPTTLPEIKPGQTVSVSVSVVNNTTTDATSIKLFIYNPDRTSVISEQLSAVSIPAGSSVQLVTSYSSLVTDVLGIYHIDYELYDSNGTIIQPQSETDTGRFAVSNPPSNPYQQRGLGISINAPSEYIFTNQGVTFTVTLWNYTDKDEKLHVYWEWGQKIGKVHSTELIVPASGSVTNSYTIEGMPYAGQRRLWVHIFSESGLKLNSSVYQDMPDSWPYAGSLGKGFVVNNPSVDVSFQTDKAFYSKGETVNLSVNLQNKQNIAFTGNMTVRVSDPSNSTVYSNALSASVPANGTSIQNLSIALPLTALSGFYTINAEIYDSSNNKIGGRFTSFEIPLSQISVTPNLPSLTTGSNTIPFLLNNTGKINVNSGALDMTLKDPDGVVISTGSQQFSIGIGQTTTVDFPISIPSLKYGNYTLTYTQSDETKTGKSIDITIPNTTTIAISLDKPSYRIRETANLTVNLTNVGKFNLDTVSVSVNSVSYTDTKTVNIGQGQAQPLQYAIPIPEITIAGQHNIDVLLTLPSGSPITQSSKFTIPESSLEIASPLPAMTGQTTLTAGDTINLTIENTGGVDTSYTTEKLSITDDKGVIIYQGNVSGTILAGEKKTLADIQIPLQTINGLVFLSSQIKDGKTSKMSYLYKTFNITGLSATLQTGTNKDVYLKTEAITGLTSITNSASGIEAGNLKITVNTLNPAETVQFTIYLPKVGGESFNRPHGVAASADGYTYVSDTFNHRIQAFGSNGNFITKWGSYGSGNGQFSYPTGIALAHDGFVYTADTGNHRIQKFDNNGNFITSWGGYGTGNGQLFYPDGIAIGLDGSVYVTDRNYRVQKFDSNGNFLVRWGSYGSGNGQFFWPWGIAVTSDGFVYVVDRNAYSIQKFDSNGNFIAKWGSYGSGDGQFNYPHGITIGYDNSVYVSDTGNHRIQKFDNNGNFIAKWGMWGVAEGQFISPTGMAVDAGNSVYIADTGNHRIQKMLVSDNSSGTLFETTIPITQPANTTQDYTTNIGTLNATGKLYLNAELKNSLGQTIAIAEYPFYVIEGNTLLLFNTDKKAYKPGETVTITGEVKNLASITASALSLQLSANSQNIYSATFDVAANSSYPFTVITTASTEGTYTLIGKVTQNNSTLVEIADSYEVAKPKATATVTVPEVVGNEAFSINVEIKNEGKVAATLQFGVQSSEFGDSQTITIPAGETKLIQYSQAITSNTTYTFNFTGDFEQTITKTVAYGLGVSITVNPQIIYPEGKIAVPVAITNTGQIDETITVDFSLEPLIQTQTKKYFIPKGGSTTDTLYYDLTEGSYQLTASSQLPVTSVQADFSVKKEIKVDMAVTVGAQTTELIPAAVNLTNVGYNEINGSVQLSVVNGQGTTIWNSSQDVFLPYSLSPTPYTLTFNINPAAIQPGDYTLKAELLNNSNQQLAVSYQPLTISGAVFALTQLPPYSIFTVGEEASFIFKVENSGNQEGAFNLHLRAYDLIDSTQREWLKPGEEKSITFSFLLPEDLEEKDYFADYEFGDSPDSTAGESGTVPTRGQVKYHVSGINLNVSATLDKQYYSEGDTAHLSIVVSGQSAVSQNLFARVNYAGYENQQSFALNASQTLTFDIPLTQITDEKLFYGIYHESGRSIHLNSLYIYKAGDAITITTNKQVYNPGEMVSVAVNSVSGITGTMAITAPNYEETFEFTGTTIKSFALPVVMTAGTYSIGYQLSDISGQIYSGNHLFDVAGISVKVKEATLDKAKYASSDTMQLTLMIESNKDMPAALKAWIIDPEGKYTSAGEVNISLSFSENLLVTHHSSLVTSVSGIHRMVYGIYAEDLLLVSGSEAFDVGDAVLVGLSTDKTDYPENTMPVSVTVNMFGTVDANLELQLDGTTVKSESVTLNGFKAVSYELSDIKPGTHALKAILTTGGLKSIKEAIFVYGSNLPDLRAEVGSQKLEVSKDNTIQIIVTAMNQGKTTSIATAIALYDGENLIETKPLKALNLGESQETTFIWNVLGKAGEHSIKAIVDPENTVIEFNEENNTSTINMTIPDITLITEIDKETYKIRQKVNITSVITNLTSTKIYNNLTLVTSAKDPGGMEVYQSNKILNNIQPSSTTTHTEVWNTSGLPVDGIYTITQAVLSDSQLLTQNSKLITLEKAPDFTLGSDTLYQKIKQGERATYATYLEPVNGWSSEITLSITGLPAGTSVSFNPSALIPSGDALTMVITTDATATGRHSLNLTAQGIDEGEVISHTLPLTLDVSGFGLNAESSDQTIKQLETATFDINIDSINGYEGGVSLSIDNIPYGIKAFFDNANTMVPGNVNLTILTSKYVRPGNYTFSITADDGLVKHNLNLTLSLLPNPEIAAGIITAQGPGPNNNAWIRLFNSNIEPVFELTAFDTKYGTYATGADIDGDGYDEIIVSQGSDPKNKAILRAFKHEGNLIAEYTAFDTKYGLTFSTGDLDGDWEDELIVGMGPDPKNPATLKILKYDKDGFTEVMTYTVFETKYGLNTAIGDIDGDGIPEIITAPGPGPNNPATVKIWKYDGQNLTELYSIEAFEGNYGANLTSGDIDGDGKAEIIIGTGPDPKNPAIVKIYRGDGALIKEFMPYDAEYGYGVTVASGDIDGDGLDEIITGLGPGPQNPAWVKVFNSDGSEIYSFISYPDDIGYGVRVSKGNMGTE